MKNLHSSGKYGIIKYINIENWATVVPAPPAAVTSRQFVALFSLNVPDC